MSKDKQGRERKKPRTERFQASANVLVRAKGKLTRQQREALADAAQVLEQRVIRRG